MTTGGCGRRALAALVAAIALWAVAVQPADAATATETAVGSWLLNDAHATQVFVQGVDGPGRANSVFVQINQRFCETSTNTAVFRSVLAQVNANPGALVVH